ncbi:MAG: hypothetical protein RJA07_954 [Bacteroidota bacterium]
MFMPQQYYIAFIHFFLMGARIDERNKKYISAQLLQSTIQYTIPSGIKTNLEMSEGNHLGGNILLFHKLTNFYIAVYISSFNEINTRRQVGSIQLAVFSS